MIYNLEQRTTTFSINLLETCKKLPKSNLTDPIINQLIRSGTSIGANYQEANGASSKKDFINKIYICKKEAKETQYWINLLEKTLENEQAKNQFKTLFIEATELGKIFSAILTKSQGV
jgi:four helix bundle protein